MYSTECFHITSFNLHKLEGMKKEVAHKKIAKDDGITLKYKNTVQCPSSEGNTGLQEVSRRL